LKNGVFASGSTLSSSSVTTACVGKTASLTVTPSSGYTYQWFIQGNSTPLTDGSLYSGTKTATLSFLNVSTSAGNAMYYCKITGIACAGSTVSDSFGLTINQSPTLSPSTLNDQSFTNTGGYAGFLYWSVQASGGSQSGYTFTWYQNGSPTSLYNSSTYDTSTLEDGKTCSCAGSWYVEVTDVGNGCTASTPVTNITVTCSTTGATCQAGNLCS
jgi:hypothetical protein